MRQTDAFVSLTGIDEENILMSLYVSQRQSAQRWLTKINRSGFENVIASLELGSIFYPRYIATERILQYVRGRQASQGSSVETLLKILNNQAEALEFAVHRAQRRHRRSAGTVAPAQESAHRGHQPGRRHPHTHRLRTPSSPATPSWWSPRSRVCGH